ncbi:MAG TPA: hypothetical protein VF268_01170, partial [Gammaproteobacteria bacterium]
MPQSSVFVCGCFSDNRAAAPVRECHRLEYRFCVILVHQRFVSQLETQNFSFFNNANVETLISVWIKIAFRPCYCRVPDMRTGQPGFLFISFEMEQDLFDTPL